MRIFSPFSTVYLWAYYVVNRVRNTVHIDTVYSSHWSRDSDMCPLLRIPYTQKSYLFYDSLHRVKLCQWSAAIIFSTRQTGCPYFINSLRVRFGNGGEEIIIRRHFSRLRPLLRSISSARSVHRKKKKLNSTFFLSTLSLFFVFLFLYLITSKKGVCDSSSEFKRIRAILTYNIPARNCNTSANFALH